MVGILVASTAVAKPAPPPPPPQCLGPDTWDSIMKCLRQDEPSLNTVVKLSEHVLGATDDSHRWGRIYVQELDGRWQNLRAFTPALQIAADTQTTTHIVARGDVPVRRIEIREIVEYGNRTQLRIKSAVICGSVAGATCQLQNYECIALQNGRTLDIVRGELSIDPTTGALKLAADRSHAGELCNL